MGKSSESYQIHPWDSNTQILHQVQDAHDNIASPFEPRWCLTPSSEALGIPTRISALDLNSMVTHILTGLSPSICTHKHTVSKISKMDSTRKRNLLIPRVKSETIMKWYIFFFDIIQRHQYNSKRKMCVEDIISFGVTKPTYSVYTWSIA